ncbi:hypothetical protein AEST_22540 [Alishewanella aestuarii B11]|jgi:hypothetical protein|uniref:Uncharacterized protein n=1 Tax=Alishewanella aestuarii B11 TaxID=1197174 RepID=J2IDB6_9ALTE|nr:hypothetical protein AEST_22540 [Alishewanella aestuarii B11]
MGADRIQQTRQPQGMVLKFYRVLLKKLGFNAALPDNKVYKYQVY